MSIPAKFREELGEKFIFAKGADGCLAIYTMAEWERMEDLLQDNNDFNKAVGRAFARQIFPSASDGELDAMGRVLIPANLREYAGFVDKMEVIVLGVANRIEVWTADRWQAYCEENAETMDINNGMEIFGF